MFATNTKPIVHLPASVADIFVMAFVKKSTENIAINAAIQFTSSVLEFARRTLKKMYPSTHENTSDMSTSPTADVSPGYELARLPPLSNHSSTGSGSEAPRAPAQARVHAQTHASEAPRTTWNHPQQTTERERGAHFEYNRGFRYAYHDTRIMGGGNTGSMVIYTGGSMLPWVIAGLGTGAIMVLLLIIWGLMQTRK
ncbi:hypothetical protein F4677DRAFT_432986 [Hypoxylon crocopeplum]|nr:hypothetical protein F4677DRAFT_432986 [Hypoxylon crocopeplum]